MKKTISLVFLFTLAILPVRALALSCVEPKSMDLFLSSFIMNPVALFSPILFFLLLSERFSGLPIGFFKRGFLSIFLSVISILSLWAAMDLAVAGYGVFPWLFEKFDVKSDLVKFMVSAPYMLAVLLLVAYTVAKLSISQDRKYRRVRMFLGLVIILLPLAQFFVFSFASAAYIDEGTIIQLDDWIGSCGDYSTEVWVVSHERPLTFLFTEIFLIVIFAILSRWKLLRFLTSEKLNKKPE